MITQAMSEGRAGGRKQRSERRVSPAQAMALFRADLEMGFEPIDVSKERILLEHYVGEEFSYGIHAIYSGSAKEMERLVLLAKARRAVPSVA